MISQVDPDVTYQKVNILEVRGYHKPSKEWIVSDFGWTNPVNVLYICTPLWYFKLQERCVANSSWPVALHDPTAPTQLLVLGKPGDTPTR